MTNNTSKWTKTENSQRIRILHQTPRSIVAWSEDYESGHSIAMHQHERAQLLFASMGTMSVTTAKGIWVVPPMRAVWIPEFTEHQILCSGKVLMRTLYIDSEVIKKPLTDCSVVSVSPLLRELILYAVDMPQLYDETGPDGRIEQVILDCIQQLEVTPLTLPIPINEGLKLIHQTLSKNPDNQRSLSEWGQYIGMTSRTLARNIKKETNLTFGQWRQQIRLLEALKRLGCKEPVTKVAMDMGYDSPSAFIAMFKKALGSTPGQYFKP